MWGYKQYLYKKRRAVRRKVLGYTRQQRAMKSWIRDNYGEQGAPARVQYLGRDYDNADANQRKIRRALAYRGKGDYYSEKVKPMLQAIVPSGTFSKAGGAIGGYFGGSLGSTAGAALGSLASKYIGFGDYGPAPVTNQIMGGGGQVTVNASDDMSGDLYFSHREFLQNVTVSGTANTQTAFQNTSFPLNPGLQTTFPFLSQIAQNFVLYEMMGCIFEYKPTSGESGSINNSLGKVIMATSYDPDAPSFVNSVQMENYDYATSCKPSVGQLHGVETANKQQFANMQYIRTGKSTRDLIFTDIGTFQIATEGIPLGSQTTQTIGELWVTYRVKLSRANLYGSLLNLNSATDWHQGQWTGANFINSGSGINFISNWVNPNTANTAWPRWGNTIGCTIVGTSSTAFTITFPANIVQGQFLIHIALVSNAVPAASVTLSLNAGTGSSVCAYDSYFQSAMTTTEQIGTATRQFQINAPGNTKATVTGSLNVAFGAGLSLTMYAIIQSVNYNSTINI